jgi:hypothetical protein
MLPKRRPTPAARMTAERGSADGAVELGMVLGRVS